MQCGMASMLLQVQQIPMTDRLQADRIAAWRPCVHNSLLPRRHVGHRSWLLNFEAFDMRSRRYGLAFYEPRHIHVSIDNMAQLCYDPLATLRALFSIIWARCTGQHDLYPVDVTRVMMSGCSYPWLLTIR